jgi:DNA recombination protein Rad52
MAFSTPQLRKLSARIRPEHVKERNVDGKTLHYIEGWHAIAEANRIFGFDAWDRETLTAQCIWQKPVDGRFAAAYLTRVRLTVRGGGSVVTREGFGAGEAIAPTPGQAHERAAKAAETDATKRALSTFGNCFGLSLYRDKQDPARAVTRRTRAPAKAARVDPPQAPVLSDSRPSPHFLERVPVDKSELTIGEPKRHRSPEHLKFVAAQPCLVCGRQPSQAHHLRYMQPRAIGRKVSDEFCVPLCASHHNEVHRTGDEYNWWRAHGIEALKVAQQLWSESRAPHEVPLLSSERQTDPVAGSPCAARRCHRLRRSYRARCGCGSWRNRMAAACSVAAT